MIGITEYEKLIKEINKCLREQLDLEKIYRKYITNFKSIPAYYTFIQEKILPVFGEDNFRSYIRSYYIRMYNSEFKWKNPSFTKFWCEIANSNILNHKKTDEIFSILREEHKKIISQFLNIPESFLKDLKFCIDNNLTILAQNYGYQNQRSWQYNTFIDEYFSNCLTSEQIYAYGEAMLKKYFSVYELFDYNEFMKYCFGDRYSKYYLEKNSCKLSDIFRYITLPYRYKNLEYKAIIDVLDKVNISDDEKEKYLLLKNVTISNNSKFNDIDIVNEKKIWDNYTEEEVKKRLEDAIEIVKKSRQKLASTRIFQVLYDLPLDVSEKYYDLIINRSKHSKLIREYIKKRKVELLNYYVKTNYESMNKIDDIWTVYYHVRHTITAYTYDFTNLPREISNNIKSYIYSAFIVNETSARKCGFIISIFKKLVDYYNFKSVNDVTELDLLKWLHDEKSKNNLSANTLRMRMYNLKEFYEYLIEKRLVKRGFINPAINLCIRNAHKNTEHIDPIPPEVRFAIEDHLDEVDNMTKIMYLIFSETGMRFGEQVECTVNDLEIDKEYPNMARLSYYRGKTKKHDIKHGTNSLRFNHISIELYYKIKDYIKETECLRKKYNDNLIFISENRGGLRCKVTSSKSVRQINKLIEKYNITTADGKPWRYTNKQMRKTVAVDLISNERSTVYHVQNLLDHFNPATTEINYAEVDSKEIMKKNTEYFRQKFSLYADEDALKYFTEEERKILYIDFLRNYREVEFGYCCKHQSEGSCEYLGENMCANCPKIVTGIKFIDKWTRLYEESVNRCNELKKIYLSAGIKEKKYSEFIEYKKEKRMMDYYKAVIDSIMQSNNE